MRKKYILPLCLLLTAGIIGAAIMFLRTADIAVLNPQGTIADEQFKLLIITSLLSLIVVIPVFVLTFYIVWKYRASNTKATYMPDWDRSKKIETIWWLIPLALILVLSVMIWRSSHELDPYRPLASDTKPITIQVIALDWKWLFIYPEQNIATVNYVQFPEKTPVNFRLTSDAPMNSFWIPKLGGQVYAMAGMETKLHLEASDIGEYEGSSANISGAGFASMRFKAQSSSKADFEQWVQFAKDSPPVLDGNEYARLAHPSKDHPVTYYSSRDPKLYDTVIHKYMAPMGMQHTSGMKHDMAGMDMSHMNHREYR